MTVIYPTDRAAFVLERVRQRAVKEKPFDDQTVLQWLNQGYQRACERSLCLPTLTTIYDVAGQAEYPLPDDHYRTLRVYRAGVRLAELSLPVAFAALDQGFYSYQRQLGLVPAPTSGLDPVTDLDSDTFGRVVALGDSWAGPWRRRHSTGGIYWVDGSAAHVGPMPAGKNLAQTISGKTAASLRQEMVLSWDITNAGTPNNDFLFGFTARWMDSQNFYRAYLGQRPDGSLKLGIRSVVAGSEATIGSVVEFQPSYVPGTVLHFLYDVDGADQELTVWVDGEEQPDPQVQISDSTFTAAGEYGVALRRDLNTLNAPTVTVDDYSSSTVPGIITSDSPRTFLLYARTPAPLTGFDSQFDPGFPPEADAALVHYIRSRAFATVGGEASISQARWERKQYELIVAKLDRTYTLTDLSAPERMLLPADLEASSAR